MTAVLFFSLDSHLDPLDLDSPWVCGVVERGLHDVGDGLPLTQDLRQVLGAQHVPEGGRGQQAGGVAGKSDDKKINIRNFFILVFSFLAMLTDYHAGMNEWTHGLIITSGYHANGVLY